MYVKHFIISNTIEGRILQIQKRKTAIVKEAFRGSGTGAEKESMENLKIMFGGRVERPRVGLSAIVCDAVANVPAHLY